MNKPDWNPFAKSDSIRKWAEHLHEESEQMFLADKSHVSVLFAFTDEGFSSVNPIPAGATHEQIYIAIRGAILEHNLYAVIHLGEVWTYFPKEQKDHTVSQLLDGEMRVNDLNEEDKTEALYLRMESRDKDCVVYLNRILRNGDKVDLGGERMMPDENLRWFT